MKIHEGTKGADRRPCHWVQPHTVWRWDLDDLVNGLCSHFFRNRYEGDGVEVPEHMTLLKILEIVRGEYESYGENAVWTWSDGISAEQDTSSREWARGVILRVLPGLEVPS